MAGRPSDPDMTTKSILMPDGDRTAVRRAAGAGAGGRRHGREVTAEVQRLAESLVAAGAIDVAFEELDWGAERYLASGEAVPPGGFERLRRPA
jgi:hypothetical protein